LGFCGTFHVFHARSSRLLIASMAMAMAKANSYSKSHLGDVSSPAVGKLDLAKDESWFKMISSSKSLGVHTYIYIYIYMYSWEMVAWLFLTSAIEDYDNPW
jgi:hypothetical protein